MFGEGGLLVRGTDNSTRELHDSPQYVSDCVALATSTVVVVDAEQACKLIPGLPDAVQVRPRSLVVVAASDATEHVGNALVRAKGAQALGAPVFTRLAEPYSSTKLHTRILRTLSLC